MPAGTLQDLRTRREDAVQAHLQAEAMDHNIAATVATFNKPRYEVPAVGAVADGAEAVYGFVEQVLNAFPDLWVRQLSLHHADDAVIVEAQFGGTQRGVWAGVIPTGKKAEVDCVLIFIFEGGDLVCEKARRRTRKTFNSILRLCNWGREPIGCETTPLSSLCLELGPRVPTPTRKPSCHQRWFSRLDSCSSTGRSGPRSGIECSGPKPTLARKLFTLSGSSISQKAYCVHLSHHRAIEFRIFDNAVRTLRYDRPDREAVRILVKSSHSS